MAGQVFLGLARLQQQLPHVARGERREFRLLDDPAEHALVPVVAAERGVAVGRNHLEHALGELEDGDIERAAAEVEHRIGTLGGILQPVGDRRGGGLVQQPQHVQAGEFGRVLGRLALRVVEVGRHRDHGAGQAAIEGLFRPRPQRLQYFRGNLDWTFHSGDRPELHHTRRVREVIGGVFGMRDVLQPSSHVALHRRDAVLRILRLLRLRRIADFNRAVRQVAHDGRQQRAALRVGQHRRGAAAHRGDQRVGGAQVDAHREALLVRLGRLSRFRDLEQRHQVSSVS